MLGNLSAGRESDPPMSGLDAMNLSARVNALHAYPAMAPIIHGIGIKPYAFGILVTSVMSITILLMTLLLPLNAPQTARLVKNISN
jgi:hypothetical protein